ncbi:hypothetical protein [Paenibacillus sp. V4I7]|uniref:hypothetical protein n=1 Tax=Paenibacillus sp. V4I7 TaxID=3042307 RepID=UPI00278B79E3|nr:hypothetical protein [Paenibacillus sp. V4I7]MDQ0899522.1 hypothetical protein [Paenibacillus sp. V4I7]
MAACTPLNVHVRAGMTVKLGENTAAKNAGVLAMTAIIENYKANAKKLAVRKGRGGTATERLTALVEQTRKLDETVQKAITIINIM